MQCKLIWKWAVGLLAVNPVLGVTSTLCMTLNAPTSSTTRCFNLSMPLFLLVHYWRWNQYISPKRWYPPIPKPFLGNGSVTRSRSNRHEGRNRKAVFSMWSMPRCYKQGKRLELSQFCRGVGEERAWAGGRGIAIVGDVTRKRLVQDWEH
jgi:hypothetical protein